MTTPPSPHEQLSRLLGGYRVTQMLHVAASLGLADRLSEGPATVERLALETGANGESLYRLLRALAPLGIFVETDDREFATTPMADLLRADAPESLRALALTYGQAWWWRSFGELLHCVRTGEDGFGKAHGASLFDYLDRHPEAAGVFNQNMSAMTRLEAQAVVDACDLDGVERVVDVGGGHGVLARAILARWPAIEAVLFDQPSVVAGAKAAHGGALPPDRCSHVGGDFFSAVPAGADLYILKDILHDWDDERAIRILRNCREAMGTRARLLVIERIVPGGNEASVAKDVDITMMVMTGGRERTEREYRELLAASGLSIRGIRMLPTGGAVIEAAADGS